MNLLSAQAVAVIFFIALVTILLATWCVGWARAWWKRGIAALCLLLACLMVSSSVMALSNKTMGWVPTTSDLWEILTVDTGAQQENITIKPADQEQKTAQDATGPRSVGHPPRDLSQTTSSGASQSQATPTPSASPTAPVEDIAFAHNEGSTLWKTHINGALSGVSSSMVVWAPADWSPTDGKTYDVVIFLHGYPGSDEGPTQALDIDNVIPALEQENAIRPTIFVVPNISIGNTEPDCVDIDGRPKVETFVTQDVVAAVRQGFPNVTTNPEGWVLSGISSGAYCAPVLAIRHPGEFYGAISMGGYDEPELGVLGHASAAIRSEMTISHMVALGSSSPINLYIAASPNDRDSMTLARDIKNAARQGDDIAEDTSVGGGHSWATWSKQLPGGLRWWGAGAERVREAKTAAQQAATPTPTPATTPTPTPNASATPTAGATDTHDPASAIPDQEASPFELKGNGTIAIAATVAVVLFFATLVGGPHLVAVPKRRAKGRHAVDGPVSRRRRAAMWFARLVMVAMTAASVSVALGVLYNRSGEFFASWSDLAQNWHSMF